MCQCVVYTLFCCDEMVAVPMQVLVSVCCFSVNCYVEVMVGSYGDKGCPGLEVILVVMVLLL